MRWHARELQKARRRSIRRRVCSIMLRDNGTCAFSCITASTKTMTKGEQAKHQDEHRTSTIILHVASTALTHKYVLVQTNCVFGCCPEHLLRCSALVLASRAHQDIPCPFVFWRVATTATPRLLNFPVRSSSEASQRPPCLYYSMSVL